jgi:hypothetical protein
MSELLQLRGGPTGGWGWGGVFGWVGGGVMLQQHPCYNGCWTGKLASRAVRGDAQAGDAQLTSAQLAGWPLPSSVALRATVGAF